MTTIIQQLKQELDNFKREILDAIENKLVTAKQVRTSTLSEISPILGLIQSFEFRTPGDPLSSTYSGVQITADGINTYNSGSQTGSIQKDGDLKFGSDISSPGSTGFQIFSQDQTYNGESMGAGDVLIGDNSSSKPNLLWDKSTGSLKFRSGTTVMNEMQSSGSLKPVGCRLRRSLTFQSVATATSVQASFDKEVFDDANFANISTSATRITIPTGYSGRYLVGGWAWFSANSTGMRSIGIVKNGDGVTDEYWIDAHSGNAGASDGTSMSCSGYFNLTEGDYLELYLFQRSGSTLTTLSDLWLTKIG